MTRTEERSAHAPPNVLDGLVRVWQLIECSEDWTHDPDGGGGRHGLVSAALSTEHLAPAVIGALERASYGIGLRDVNEAHEHPFVLEVVRRAYVRALAELRGERIVRAPWSRTGLAVDPYFVPCGSVIGPHR